ncbi:hypothetical protein ADUPG1_009496 [Aduncisulcus paluster]|uniref:N-acetyltransferase domain-containing protein n=1 Tax=Aduncisulcus paluster TaxID=2918883 RepID=A0ABQ5KVT9_9EUKA|nr:hypothetical protein ADUPG1_009496 [Aduncisulcus paluster]
MDGVFVVGKEYTFPYHHSFGVTVEIQELGSLSKEQAKVISCLYTSLLPSVSVSDCTADITKEESFTFAVLATKDSLLEEKRRKAYLQSQRPSKNYEEQKEESSYEEDTTESDDHGPVMKRYVSSCESEEEEEEEEEESSSIELLQKQMLEESNISETDEFLMKSFSKNHPGKSLESLVHEDMGIAEFEEPSFAERLVAAVTVLSHVGSEVKPPTNIIQLLYIGVRSRYQSLKIGRKLVKLVQRFAKNRKNDAFIVWAGLDAENFFRRCGFSRDPILTHRYIDIDDDWTDSVCMCWPISGGAGAREMIKEKSKDEIAQQFSHDMLTAASNGMFAIKSLLDELEQEKKMRESSEYLMSILEEKVSRFRKQLTLLRTEVEKKDAIIKELEGKLADKEKEE